MKHIILDTNMLMAIAQFKVDVFAELRRICDFRYDVAVLDRTVDELKKIKAEQRGKHKLAASISLQIISKNNIKITKTAGKEHVDDILVDRSKKGYLIATQDIGLKKRLKKPYITIRKKQYLILV